MHTDWKSVIDRYYPVGREVRDILLQHSHSVADLAIQIAHEKHLPLTDDEVETAAMLHDIGIIATDAPGIDCHGAEPYLAHGAVGADMLRHTGAGLTAEEIAEAQLPLPPGRDYMPQTLLEKLICYADCFYSKGGDMKIKPLDRVRKSMAKFSPGVAERFEKLHELFS